MGRFITMRHNLHPIVNPTVEIKYHCQDNRDDLVYGKAHSQPLKHTRRIGAPVELYRADLM